MQFSNPDFSATVRTLTGLGGALVQSQGLNIALAGTSTATFTATATTKAAMYTIAATANAGGTVLIQFTDGTNTFTVQTIAISTSGIQDVSVNANAAFWQVHNNSATAAVLFYAGFLLVG